MTAKESPVTPRDRRAPARSRRAVAEPPRLVSHVFIVGLPRTGTTLVRNILNRSPDAGLGGESHFFTVPRRLGLMSHPGIADQLAGVGDLSTDEGVERVVAWIVSRTGVNFWGKLAERADRAAFERQLLASDRTPRAVLDLCLAVYAGDRRIRGDKTPAHIHVVPTLLEWFPDARIIHTVRDPRAVFVSNLRKYADRDVSRTSRLFRRLRLPFELYSALDVALEWRRIVRLHRGYVRRYPDRYAVVRFEDLLADPRREVERLCRFVGIGFHESLLDQSVANSSFAASEVRHGFDTAATDRWRAHLDPLTDRWFRFWCGDQMRQFGYR
jgi:hypothetical protein